MAKSVKIEGEKPIDSGAVIQAFHSAKGFLEAKRICNYKSEFPIFIQLLFTLGKAENLFLSEDTW